MAGDGAGRAQSGNRSQCQRDNRHLPHICNYPIPSRITWDIGCAVLFQGFNRTAAAGALDKPHHRQAIFKGELFGRQLFAADAGIISAATNGKVITNDNHRSARQLGASKNTIGRAKLNQLAVFIIFCGPRDCACFMKTAIIDQQINAFAHIQSPGIMLACQFFFSAHGISQFKPLLKFVQFCFPAHPHLPIYHVSSGTMFISQRRYTSVVSSRFRICRPPIGSIKNLCAGVNRRKERPGSMCNLSPSMR